MSYNDALKTRLLQQECHFTWSLREGDFVVSDLLNRLEEQIQLESGKARVTRAYSSFGFVHYLYGNLKEALENLQKSVKLAKEYYKEKSDEVLIVTYGGLAWLHYYMEEFSICEDYLRLLERIHGTSAGLIYTIPLQVLRDKGWAFLKFSRKYYNGAKECFRQALEMNPDDSDLNTGYAIALYRTAGTSDSENSQTIKQLQRAVKLDPDDAVLLVLLALKTRNNKGDEKASQNALKMVLYALLKSSENPHVMRYAAQFFQQLGTVDEAICLLDEALLDTPNSAFIHHQLAKCYSKKNQKKTTECNEMDLKRCIYHLEKAIALKPSFITAMAELALQYGKLGRLPEAEKMFEEAFKMAHNNKEHLQRVYCVYGQYQLWYQRCEEKAIYNFMQGLRLQPKSFDGKSCENHLRKIGKRLHNSHHSKACGIYGFIHEVKGEKLKAAELYQRALTNADGESSLLTEMRIWLMSFKEAGTSVLKLIFDQGSYDKGLGSGGLKTVKGTMDRKIVNLVEIDICNAKTILRREKLALNPGPHAVILNFSLDHGEFTGKTKEILEGLEFLGDKFWNHVIVVFTEGDSSMSEYHGSQGRVLAWLLEKCGRRYYISGSASNVAEMGELSQRILEMIYWSNKSMHLLLPEISDGDTQSLSEVFTGTDISDDVFTPEIIVQEGQTVYRYCVERPVLKAKSLYEFTFISDLSLKSNRVLCSHAGWFHCKFTQLGFHMKGEGEVLYSTVLQESSCPIPANCYPAGPLYDIRCVQGELRQLRLPHCETSIEDAIHSMSVVHYSGDIVEVLKPQNITSTHVSVSIPGTSRFWLTKSINWFKAKIFAQVMLFYVQPGHKLHVFLQPRNVDPRDVAAPYANYELIQTTSECTLNYNSTYSISCDPVEERGPPLKQEMKIQPLMEKFCCSFKRRDHYSPTFQIRLPKDVMNVRLSLKKVKPDAENVKVWDCEINLKEDVIKKSVTSSTAEQCISFLKDNRSDLIQRVKIINPILDGLTYSVHPEDLEKISTMRTCQDKMRAIYKIVDAGGPALKQKFFSLLMINQKDLVEELMTNKSTGNLH